jgi:CHRD domain
MAQGQATFRLSKDGKRLIYRLSVTNIKDVSMAHIHLAAAGENGPVVVWLYPSKPPAMVKTGMFSGLLARGTITAANLMGPLKGKSIADLVDELKMGKTYVNVHTKEHPEGEIRGQIE